jgi:hypothetical protein
MPKKQSVNINKKLPEQNIRKQQLSSKNKTFFSIHVAIKITLFLGTLLLYGRTSDYDYGIDDKFILSAINNTENSFSGFLSIFKSWFAGADYRPISVLSFWLERLLFNEAGPGISHMVNVILFGVLLVILFDFIVICRFKKEENKLILLGFICCLLFLVHPNHVSIVANIKARDNLLSMLFGLTASIQLIRYFDEKRLFRIGLFIVLISLALFSKLDAYAFIIAPLLVILFFREIDRKKLINALKIISITGIIVLIILVFFRSMPNDEEYIFSIGYDENPLVNNDTLVNRISLSLTSILYYIKFLFIPFGYYFFFGYNQVQVTGIFSVQNFISLFILISFFAISIKLYHRNKIYLFSLLFFLISIAYALNLYVLVAGIVMDKYNFIASLGFCLAVASIIIDLYYSDSLSLKKISLFIFPFIFFTFLGFTISRTNNWKNSFTLIEKDMPYLKQSVNANRMAAAAYINLALAEELKPGANRVICDSLIQTGEKYAIAGLKIYDKVPDLWELRGLSSFYRKEYEEALGFFLKSKEVDSTYLSSINYVGYTYWALNNIDSASFYFKYVIEREPVFNYAANNLIDMLIRNNRKAEADSILNVLKTRFPEDKWLLRKINSVSNN